MWEEKQLFQVQKYSSYSFILEIGREEERGT
jgi:hypothetical protein